MWRLKKRFCARGLEAEAFWGTRGARELVFGREGDDGGLPKRRGPPGSQQLGEPRLDHRAELLRGRGSQHVPTADLQQNRAEHGTPAAHAEPAQTQPILQAAVRRFDPGACRVPIAEHARLFFDTAFGEAAGLVRELQFEAIIRRLMDRAELQQRARRTGEGRHLDDRGVSRRVARDVQGRVAGGTRLDRVGHFMMCEVVERQFSGFHVRNAARHGAISSTPNDSAIT